MYVVVFRNRKRADIDQAAYDAVAAAMEAAALTRPGYISFKSYVAEDGEVVALSEWADEASARAWGRDAEHLSVKQSMIFNSRSLPSTLGSAKHTTSAAMAPINQI